MAGPRLDLRLHLADSAASEAFGERLAEALREADGGVIYLTGTLGAGKTTIARALLRHLGVTGAIKSPTYTLMEPYEVGGRRLLHMDFYRIEAADLEQLGLDDYPPDSTLWLVEWPEKVAGALPPADLELHLMAEAEGRSLLLKLPDNAKKWAKALAVSIQRDST